MENVSPFRSLLDLIVQLLGIDAVLLPQGHIKSHKWNQNNYRKTHIFMNLAASRCGRDTRL